MKNIILVMVGVIFIIFAVLCPFPNLLGVSGIVWRLIIGFIGCFMIVLGIYRTRRKG